MTAITSTIPSDSHFEADWRIFTINPDRPTIAPAMKRAPMASRNLIPNNM